VLCLALIEHRGVGGLTCDGFIKLFVGAVLWCLSFAYRMRALQNSGVEFVRLTRYVFLRQ